MVTAYSRFATQAIDAWATGAKAMAVKVESGSYGPAEWMTDAVNYTADMCRIGYEWLEGLITGRIVERVVSGAFSTTQRGPGTRTLELAGALQGAMPPQDKIARSRVRLVPAQLHGTETSFRLDVDATGCHGDAYTGSVRVMDGMKLAETIAVVVQVP
jgi:hypothetical protein